MSRSIWSPTGLLVMVLVVAGLYFGIKALATGGNDDSSQSCAILANGNRLCGQDLVAYCRAFENGSLDQETVQACAQVGVDVVK